MRNGCGAASRAPAFRARLVRHASADRDLTTHALLLHVSDAERDMKLTRARINSI